jgi:hypothetical protein
MGVAGENAWYGAFHREKPHFTEAGSNTVIVAALMGIRRLRLLAGGLNAHSALNAHTSPRAVFGSTAVRPRRLRRHHPDSRRKKAWLRCRWRMPEA